MDNHGDMTTAQTDTKRASLDEARAIAHKLQDVVDGTDGWLNVNKATDIIAYTLAALNDECQRSMREIAIERKRADRAETELVLEGEKREFWREAAARDRAQLIEARKAMELARAVLAQSITAGYNVPGPTPEDIEKAFWALDAALNEQQENANE